MVTAELTDTPYHFVQRLSATEVELVYGEGDSAVNERWRLADRRNVCADSYRIRVDGLWYRFAGRLRGLCE